MAHDQKMKQMESEEYEDFSPEDGFSLEFSYDMIINIHFRERWMSIP
jgi:hypothetical protein